jgi:uncharacterized protein (UPF0332 family)
MKAETGDYLAKARAALADAHRIATLPLPHVAAREAYVAMFHAAEAYIFEQTDKVAKIASRCAHRICPARQAGARIGRDLVTFLVTAYQFKQRADYAIGPTAVPITSAEAATALADAARFIDTLTKVVPPGPTSLPRPGVQP